MASVCLDGRVARRTGWPSVVGRRLAAAISVLAGGRLGKECDGNLLTPAESVLGPGQVPPGWQHGQCPGLAHARHARPAEFIQLLSSEANEVASKDQKNTIQPDHVVRALQVRGPTGGGAPRGRVEARLEGGSRGASRAGLRHSSSGTGVHRGQLGNGGA